MAEWDSFGEIEGYGPDRILEGLQVTIANYGYTMNISGGIR